MHTNGYKMLINNYNCTSIKEIIPGFTLVRNANGLSRSKEIRPSNTFLMLSNSFLFHFKLFLFQSFSWGYSLNVICFLGHHSKLTKILLKPSKTTARTKGKLCRDSLWTRAQNELNREQSNLQCLGGSCMNTFSFVIWIWL